MTSRVRPESREEVEARTKKWREKGQATSVHYDLACTIQHAGIRGRLAGARDGEPVIKVYRDHAAVVAWFEVNGDELEALVEFLGFVREEILTLRENYERISDTAAD